MNNRQRCPRCSAENARVYHPGAPGGRPQITSAADAAAVVVPLLEALDREHCLLASLDTQHRLLGVTTVSIGSADHTFMSPREIFRDALLAGATGVFVAHNHPSGDDTPSSDDRLVTRRLTRAGALLGIPVLDHLVVGAGSWTSLAALGVIETC